MTRAASYSHAAAVTRAAREVQPCSYQAPRSGVATVGGVSYCGATGEDPVMWGTEHRAVTWAQYRQDYLTSARAGLVLATDESLTRESGALTPWELLRHSFAGREAARESWVGLTLEECREVLETGGCERITRPVREALAALRAETHAPRIAPSVVGAWDIPAVITGRPLPALARTRGPAPVRHIDIAVALTVKQSVESIAHYAARIARAAHDYSLTRGTVTASVVWVSGTDTGPMVEYWKREGYKNADKAAGYAKLAPAAFRHGAERTGAPWAPELAATGWTGRVDAHACRTVVQFDPCNIQEIAAALSPSVVRMHYIGLSPYAHTRNRAGCPEWFAWPRADDKAYRITIDADTPAATAASICKALEDC